MSELKTRLQSDMKAALRAGERDRLLVIRSIIAAVQQREIDERIELDDLAVLAVLEKMRKQRRESISQYQAADRPELADREAAEIAIIEGYLPAPLGLGAIAAAIEQAINSTGANGPADMGRVIAALKPIVAGRADMGELSKQVRARLTGS